MKVSTLIELLSGAPKDAEVAISTNDPDFERLTSFSIGEMEGREGFQVILGNKTCVFSKKPRGKK